MYENEQDDWKRTGYWLAVAAAIPIILILVMILLRLVRTDPLLQQLYSRIFEEKPVAAAQEKESAPQLSPEEQATLVWSLEEYSWKEGLPAAMLEIYVTPWERESFGPPDPPQNILRYAVPFADLWLRENGPVTYLGCKKSILGFRTLRFEVRDPRTGGRCVLCAKPVKPLKRFSYDTKAYNWSIEMPSGDNAITAGQACRLFLDSFKGQDPGRYLNPRDRIHGAHDTAVMYRWAEDLGFDFEKQ